jgi:hypothetical protein
MDYRIVLGVIATILGIVGYFPYFRNIFLNKTKPHPFTWFVWGLLTAIAFAAQISDNAGPGAWASGITAIACFAIAALGVFKGENKYSNFDWICFVASMLAIFIWWFTKNPLYAVILISVTDAVAFLPSFRKSFYKPFEETVSSFILSGIKFAIAIAALTTFSVTNWLYPASLVLMNGAYAVLIIVRRKQLGKKKLK